jgi:hypothetical protein
MNNPSIQIVQKGNILEIISNEKLKKNRILLTIISLLVIPMLFLGLLGLFYSLIFGLLYLLYRLFFHFYKTIIIINKTEKTLIIKKSIINETISQQIVTNKFSSDYLKLKHITSSGRTVAILIYQQKELLLISNLEDYELINQKLIIINSM